MAEFAYPAAPRRNRSRYPIANLMAALMSESIFEAKLGHHKNKSRGPRSRNVGGKRSAKQRNKAWACGR